MGEFSQISELGETNTTLEKSDRAFPENTGTSLFEWIEFLEGLDCRAVSDLNVDQALAMLRPEIEELEDLRLSSGRIRRKGKLIYYGSLACFLVGGYWLSSVMENPLGFVLTLPIFLVFGFMAHFKYVAHSDHSFRSAYKTRFVARIVELFVPGLTYQPDFGVSSDLFYESGVSVKADRYTSEDLFQGKVGATEVQFSEVHTQIKRTRQNANGGSVTYYETVFQGVFFVADFHKEFRSPLSVMPDLAEQHLGWIGEKLQKIGGNLLKMENPEFEKRFVVRGEDSVEARYILTPTMQEQLVQLGKRVGQELRVVFRDSKVYLGIPNDDNWFEGDPEKPVGDRDTTIRLLSEIKSCLVIVDELNLNTRIWTKE